MKSVVKNYLLILRSLWRGRAVTSLNVIGLSVGITFGLLIFIFVSHQQSMDDFIPNIDKIYSVTDNGRTYLSYNEINQIRKELPEVDKITFCSRDWSPQIFFKKENSSFRVNKIFTADSCFFRVFEFEAVYGDPQNALNTTNKIVLTRSYAEKIFGKQNPVGESLVYNSTYLNGERVEVGAVIEDLPNNSSWDFEAVLSFQTNFKIGWYVRNMNFWGTRNYKVFARLNGNVTEASVRSKMASLPMDGAPKNHKYALSLFSFKDVYYDLHELNFLKHGNRMIVSIVIIIGLLIIVLSCINYVNLLTAQREKRNKNLGIIRIMGGSDSKIVGMITSESFIQLLLSVVLSILLLISLLPAFNRVTQLSFSISDLFTLKHTLLLLFMLGLMLLITGVVPGIVFSKRLFALALISGDKKRSNGVRNGLLLFQFTTSIVLLIAIFAINRQTSYLKGKDIGFEKSAIVYAHMNSAMFDQHVAFKNELDKISGVKEYTFSDNVIVQNNQNWGREIVNRGQSQIVNFSKQAVTSNFFDFFNIKMKAGNGFDEASDNNWDIVINESAQKAFDIRDVKDAKLERADPKQGHFVGVVEDFNFESLHVPIRPAAFFCARDYEMVIYLKLNGNSVSDYENTIAQVTTLWNRLSPEFPFEYSFLDSTWDAYYKSDLQFQKIILYTTLISLLLSCLGLIGLTYFVVEQKIKEVGIRKVNGAKISEVLLMLNSDFVKWIIIAFVIACPIAFFSIQLWLDGFAYKASVGWWIYASGGFVALLVAMLTVSWQSWRAATRNPVEALRYE